MKGFVAFVFVMSPTICCSLGQHPFLEGACFRALVVAARVVGARLAESVPGIVVAELIPESPWIDVQMCEFMSPNFGLGS